jgi:hypothetical protein
MELEEGEGMGLEEGEGVALPSTPRPAPCCGRRLRAARATRLDRAATPPQALLTYCLRDSRVISRSRIVRNRMYHWDRTCSGRCVYGDCSTVTTVRMHASTVP